MSQSTQLAATYAVNTAITNGNAPNTLTGVSIGTDGTLNFVYTSGSTIPGYKIPLATVASPDSLTAVNGTVYSPNVNSGAAAGRRRRERRDLARSNPIRLRARRSISRRN